VTGRVVDDRFVWIELQKIPQMAARFDRKRGVAGTSYT